MELEPFHRTSIWNLKTYWWLRREDGITKQSKGARECEVCALQHTQLHGMVPNFAHLANAFKLGMKQGLEGMHFCTHVLSWFNLGFSKEVTSHHTATFLSNTMSICTCSLCVPSTFSTTHILNHICICFPKHHLHHGTLNSRCMLYDVAGLPHICVETKLPIAPLYRLSMVYNFRCSFLTASDI
jgi:hypothetical protein